MIMFHRKNRKGVEITILYHENLFEFHENGKNLSKHKENPFRIITHDLWQNK